VLALVAATPQTATGAGVAATKIVLIALTLLGVVGGGAYAFRPSKSWFGQPEPSPVNVAPVSSPYVAPMIPGGCHAPQPQ